MLEAKVVALLQEGKVGYSYVSLLLCRAAAVLHSDVTRSYRACATCPLLQWAELLSTAGDAPAFALHRAYALYRSDRFDDALAALATATEDAREGEGALHLAAQVLYRSGRYGEAAATYDRLLTALLADAGGDASALEGPDADEDLRAALDDLRLNMAAAYVAAGRARELLTHPQFGRVMDALMRAAAAAAAAATTGAAAGAGAAAGKEKDPLAVASAGMAWELLYNLACALIDAGQASAAMRALCASAARGKVDLLADGASESEITNDLAIVRAQAAYLLQAGGYADAAAALYADVLRCRPSDVTVPAVAAINGAAQAALSGGRELVDALRRLKATAASASTVGKLLQRHVAALHHNAALLAGCVGQTADATASAGKAAAALETMRRSAAAAAAAAAGSSGSGSGASAAIDPHAQSLSLSLDVLTAALERVSGGTSMPDALAAVAAAPPASLAAAAGQKLPGGAVHPLTALRAASAVTRGAADEAVSLLLGAGAAASGTGAAAALHPAAVSTCAHVLLSSGQAARAKELLANQAAAWGAAAAAAAPSSGAGKGGPAPASAAAAAGDAHASLTHALASLHMAEGQMDAAATLLESLHSGASSGGALLAAELRGAALAALSVVRTRQAAAPGVSEGDRSSLLAAADMCLREATALVVGAGGRKPSFVMDPSRLADAELDSLENAAADPLASAAAAAAAARRAAAAAGGAGAGAGAASAGAASAGAASEEEAARAAARQAAAKKRRLARRARRREAYVTALKARSPEFARLGVLPSADPERWLPKRERTYGKKSRRRAIAKAAATVKTGGAQGAALNASVMASLDAKAKADAAKAAGGAGAASSPAKSSVTSPPPGAGKRKGGRR